MMTGEIFGTTPSDHLDAGREVERFTIAGGGLTLNFLTYGALLQDARLDGHEAPLVLGFEEFPPYLTDSPFFGAMAGRCANRVGGGRFEIDGETFQTDQNFLGKHMLHGGAWGMGKRVWDVVNVTANSVTFEIDQADGDMGFPGRLVTRVTFSCLEGGVFDIQISAKTDKPTLCNIAHHSYFNLDGEATLHAHKLQLDADRVTVVDEEFIPTGESRDVTGSRFDFRTLRPVLDETIVDHNLCLSDRKTALRRIGVLTSDASGVSMEMHSTEPGIQVYDGFKLGVGPAGLDGRQYGANSGIALEPQIWPDAINHDDFPDVILRPGETYRQHSQFRFSKGERT